MGIFSRRFRQKKDTPLDDFLNGEPVFNSRMSATNPGERSRVVLAQYLAETEALMIEYAGGVAWIYRPVSREEATDFFGAASWGKWLWSNVRVRGTVHNHQIEAKQLR